MDTKVFSTKSERKERKNPKVDGVYIIGMDMGYSGPKCFHENGNFVFPNYCKKIEGELFGELNKNDMVYENLQTGEKYFVGSKAIKDLSYDSVVSESALYERNHYLHEDFKIMFETALGVALWNATTNCDEIFLQTGLPPAYLKRDETYIRRAMEGTHRFALRIENERKIFDVTLNAEQIDVMSQPMGTYYSVLIDDDGKMTPNVKAYSGANLMVFDGGFGTLDKFLIQNNHVTMSETDGNLGMRRILDETRNLMVKEAHLMNVPSIPAMQIALRTGKIQDLDISDVLNITSKEYEIAPYLERANAMVRDEALKSIGTSLAGLKYLVMTGGTGSAWYEYFKQKLRIPGLEVLPGNANSNIPTIYANARGYYMYRLNMLKRERKNK